MAVSRARLREIISDALQHSVTEFIGQVGYEDIPLETMKEIVNRDFITIDEIAEEFKKLLQDNLKP